MQAHDFVVVSDFKGELGTVIRKYRSESTGLTVVLIDTEGLFSDHGSLLLLLPT